MMPLSFVPFVKLHKICKKSFNFWSIIQFALNYKDRANIKLLPVLYKTIKPKGELDEEMVRKRQRQPNHSSAAKATVAHTLASAANPECITDMPAATLKQQAAIPELSKLAHVSQDQQANVVQKQLLMEQQVKRIGSVLNAATGHAHSQLSYDVINAAVAGAKQRGDLKDQAGALQTTVGGTLAAATGATSSFTSSSSGKQNVAFRPFKIQKQFNTFAHQATQTATGSGLVNHNLVDRQIRWNVDCEELKQNDLNMGEVTEEEKDEGGGESSSLMNLSNTPINFGTNDQEVQLVKKCGNSSSSRSSDDSIRKVGGAGNSSSRCKSVIRSSKSSSFDSARLMYLNRDDALACLQKPKKDTLVIKHKKRRANRHDRQPSSDLFSSNERVSSISFDSVMQPNCAVGHRFGDDAAISVGLGCMTFSGEIVDEDVDIIDEAANFEIFADYDESLDIMEAHQQAKFEQLHGAFKKEERASRRHSQSSSCLNTNNSQELCQHQDLHEQSPEPPLLHEGGSPATGASQGRHPTLQSVEYQQDALQAFAQDQNQIRQLLTHCLYCIYRQQGLEKYFCEMVTVGRLVRAYWQTATDLPLASKGRCTLQEQLHAQTQPAYLRDMLASIIDEIMKSICAEITQKMRQLGVIVKEPLVRRASVDDYQLCFDYFSRRNANCHNLINGSCFGPHSLGNCSVFTNNVDLRNLANDDDDDCCVSSSLSDLPPEDSATGEQQLDEFTLIQEALKKKRKVLGGLCGHWQGANACGQGNGNNNNAQYQLTSNGTGLNTQLLVAYKQQQEMYMDSRNGGYEFIRAEGKRSTWHDIRSSRIRLQKFLYRQQEYKQVFDLIMRSYQQLQDSFEYLEELWIYLYEAIYDKSQGGKLQFDKIWKDLFLERILDDKYIKHFLNDVSDQQEYLLNYNQGEQAQNKNRNSRYILDEIYCNLEKLESDINHDYVMDDLTNFISLDEAIDSAAGSLVQQAASQDLIQSAHQQLLNSQLTLVIQNQYEILQEKFRLKYGGQTLCQLVNACHGQNFSDAQALQHVQLVVLKTRELQEALGHAQQAQKAAQNYQQHDGKMSAGTQATEVAAQTSPSKKRKRRKPKKKKNDASDELNNTENQAPEQEENPEEQPEPVRKNKEEIQKETQALFRKLMTQKQKTKSQQKPKTKTRDELALAEAEEEKRKLAEEERLRKEAAEADEALRLSKKKKLNQKKKRQRNQKKRRLQEEAQMMQGQQEQFDYQEFMSDSQLRLLIQRYDANMGANDVEYLMQMEDRERVITTLCAKLVEREQLQQYEYDEEDYGDEEDEEVHAQHFDDDDDYHSRQYDFATETQRVSKLMTTAFDAMLPMDAQQQRDVSNGMYFEDVPDDTVHSHQGGGSAVKRDQQTLFPTLPNAHGMVISNSISPAKRNRKKVGKQLGSHASQVDSNFRVTNWSQRGAEAAVCANNIEIIDQVACLSNQRSSTRGRGLEAGVDDAHSKISFEEEIYDEEFERELKHFQDKLKGECSLERIYCQQQRHLGSSQRNGSRGSSNGARRIASRKLVPNVSSEWINELKQQLRKTMQYATAVHNKSLDHRRQQQDSGEVTLSNGANTLGGHCTRHQYCSLESCDSRYQLALATQTGSSDTRRGERLAPPDRAGWDAKTGAQAVPQIGLIPHNLCMTNSTSFNSPRAADKACFEDEAVGMDFIIGGSTTYEEDGNQRLSVGAPYPGAAASQTMLGDGQTAAAGLFMNVQEEQDRATIQRQQQQAQQLGTSAKKKGKVQAQAADKGTGKKRQKKNLQIEMQHQSA